MACQYHYKGKILTKDELIQEIKDNNTPLASDKYRNYTIHNEADMKELFGMTDNIEKDISNIVGTESFNKLKEFNPSIKFELNDLENSKYDLHTNTISISLSELFQRAKDSENLEFKDFLNFIVEHEIGHAMSTPALEKGSNLDDLTRLFDVAKRLNEKNKFVDVARDGFTDEDGNAYAFKNVYEFAAEVYANPYFVEYLKKAKNTKGETIFDKVINFFRNLLNMGEKSSLYNEVSDFLNSTKIKADNLESLQAVQDGSVNMTMTEPQHGADFTINTTRVLQNRDGEVGKEVVDIFNKFPKAIAEITSNLKKVDPKSKEAMALTRLLDNFSKLKDNKERVVQGINAINIVFNSITRIRSEVHNLSEEPDENKKLIKLQAYSHEVNSFEYIIPLITDIIKYISDPKIATTDTDIFKNQLLSIEGSKQYLQTEYIKLARVSLVRLLAMKEINDVKSPLFQLREQIKHHEQLRDEATAENDKDYQNHKVKELYKRVDSFPIEDTLIRKFTNQLADVTFTDLNLQAYILNKDPLIQSLGKLLKDKDSELSRYMNAIENRGQKIHDEYLKNANIKSVRNIQNANAPVQEEREIVKDVKEDDKGNITFEKIKQRQLLSSYNPKIISIIDEKQSVINYYQSKKFKLDAENDDKNEDAINALDDKMSVLRNELYQYKKTHINREYLDKYYEHKEILNERLDSEKKDKNGNIIYTTLNEERSNLFGKIEGFEADRQQEMTHIERQHSAYELENVYRELQELSLLTDDQGNLKTGLDKTIAEQSIKYSESKKKAGDYIITPESRELYELDKQSLLDAYLIKQRGTEDAKILLGDKLKANSISQNTYDKELSKFSMKETLDKANYKQGLSNIKKTNLSEKFFEDIKELDDEINMHIKIIQHIPELNNYFDSNGVKDNIIEKYAKIKSFVKSFRDSEGTIDGIAFSKAKPELVILIKNIQQDIEKAREAIDSIKNLSKQDRVELADFQVIKKSRLLSADELVKYNKLLDDKASKELVYEKNKSDLDAYYAVVKEKAEMSTSNVTSYYVTEVEKQLASTKIQIENDITANLDEYLKNNNLKKETDGFYQYSTNKDGILEKVLYAATQIELVAKLSDAEKIPKFKESEWYKNNHYQALELDRGTQQYLPIDKPIYIWTSFTPTDEKYTLEDQPAQKYTTFKPKAELINADFKEIAFQLGSPKKSSVYYKNERYDELKNDKSSEGKAKFKYLESLRNLYVEMQENAAMSSRDKMFDLLPSVSKTHNENKVLFTDSFFNGKLFKNNEAATLKMSETQDEQVAQDGSISSFYKDNKHVAFRYNGTLDTEKQSHDVMSMILEFGSHNYNASNMKVLQPVMEAAKMATQDLMAVEEKTITGSLNFATGKKFIKGELRAENNKEYSEIQAVNTQKMIQHLLDTYIYGETKTETKVNLGALGVIDAHKVVGEFKRVAAHTIFAFKIFSPLKNSIAGKLQGIINSTLGEGFATEKDYAWATVEAAKQIPTLWKDQSKFGDKSLIGQQIRYFQVLSAGIHDEYGKKVQWNNVVNAPSYFAIAKNLSELELQISSFYAISRANKVKLSTGEEVNFLDAFELKDGNLVQKTNSNISEDEINKFVAKVQLVNLYINGAFRSDEKAKISKNPLGDMAGFLNGFVMSGIKARFNGGLYNASADSYQRGSYTEAFQFLRNVVKYHQNLSKTYNTLSLQEKAHVMRFVKEISMATVFTSLIFLMGGTDSKDKLRKNSGLYNYFLALMIATASEVQTFIPLPGLGGDEFIRKITSPFAALRQTVSISKLFGDILDIAIPGGDTGRFKRGNGIKDGLHDADDPKFIADFAKLFGWNYAEFFGLEKLQQAKSAQMLR